MSINDSTKELDRQMLERMKLVCDIRLSGGQVEFKSARFGDRWMVLCIPIPDETWLREVSEIRCAPEPRKTYAIYRLDGTTEQMIAFDLKTREAAQQWVAAFTTQHKVCVIREFVENHYEP